MYFYINAIHTGLVLHLVCAIILLLHRKQGERSRTILGLFQLFSVFNYLFREIAIHNGEIPTSVMTVPMLLLGVFMVITYMIYPAEVISPGWVSFKKAMIGYSPILVLYLFYRLTIWIGVEYHPYHSLLEMMPHIDNFDVMFRFSLCLLIFLPPFLLYFVPYSKRYNNTNREWVWKYIIIAAVKSMAYIAVLMFENMPVHILYYYITSITSLYLVYLEIFERIIPCDLKTYTPVSTAKIATVASEDQDNEKNNSLFKELESYVISSEVWRDPDLSFECLTKELKTNRTTLWQAIVNEGITYNYFIAKIRIEEYINIVCKTPSCRYMNAFYEVGYRSKTTALRNFKLITGMTPSEYFKQKDTTPN